MTLRATRLVRRADTDRPRPRRARITPEVATDQDDRYASMVTFSSGPHCLIRSSA
jgi:hypothetical protein